MSDWAAALQSVIAILGLPVLILTLIYVGVQAKYMRYAAMVQSYQSAVTIFNDQQKYLIEHPEYMPYFYDKQLVHDHQDDFDRLRALAEWRLDAAHDLLVLKKYMPEYEWWVWETAIWDIYHTSPIMQRLLKEHPDWWTDALREFLNGPRPVPNREPQKRSWWRKLFSA